MGQTSTTGSCHVPSQICSRVQPTQLEHHESLQLMGEEDLDSNAAGDTLRPKPAEPVIKTSTLPLTYFYYKQHGKDQVFVDRKLPPAQNSLSPHARFDQNYFITLSNLVSAAGPTWAAGTPNHLGARLRLMHTELKLDLWRKHLIGYQDIELCQYLEYGFPLGLRDDPAVESWFVISVFSLGGRIHLFKFEKMLPGWTLWSTAFCRNTYKPADDFN